MSEFEKDFRFILTYIHCIPDPQYPGQWKYDGTETVRFESFSALKDFCERNGRRVNVVMIRVVDENDPAVSYRYPSVEAYEKEVANVEI